MDMREKCPISTKKRHCHFSLLWWKNGI